MNKTIHEKYEKCVHNDTKNIFKIHFMIGIK